MSPPDAAGPPETAHPAWHALAIDEALKRLGADPAEGLGPEEAADRRARYGPNRLTARAPRTGLMRLAAQFDNLFIYLLLVAGAVTAALGEWVDSGVIFGVVVVIGVIGFVQEGRAERALEAVGRMLSHTAFVLRAGERREIAAEDLVPGDIVTVGAGDRVPADLKFLRAKGLQVQEAVLTGESVAVDKRPEPVAADAELAERACLAFSGTLVTAGQGTGVVVATGDETQIGRISGLLAEVESLKTPLMRRLDAFAKELSVAILALAALTFAVGALAWGREWAEMFFAAVSIAVAAIPEGLPAVMTVTLAIGVERMARRRAIIRRLSAVESLGSVTIICSDKTGTMTRNEMTVRTLRTAEEELEVEGVGYAPHGALLAEGRPAELEDRPVALLLVRAGLLANDSALGHADGEWTPQGDPTEVALIVLAHKAGLDPGREQAESPRADAIPFASERRYMATLNHDHSGRRFIHVKGAPERVLEMCAAEQREDGPRPIDAEAWHRRAEEIAGRGQRVLAVARKSVKGPLAELDEADAEEGLVLLGLFGLIDPPRAEAVQAVAACQSAGIRVKMITGDHALTARAVARDLGLENAAEVLTGRELEGIGADELRAHAARIDVFARASPEHKLRLVEALQAEGEITAMTGDGVNDAPALKRADIGIAMGRKGTEAAREAAEMVLADDNFASIARAVEEGRTVHDNIRKAILFILPTNAAQALVIVAAVLLGLVLPITPVQILWVNMVTAITLGIAFAWERAEGDVMRRPPRPADEPLLSGLVLWRVAFVGGLLLLGVGLLFVGEEGRGATGLEFARTIAVNALVMGQIFYLLTARSYLSPAFTLDGLFGSRAVLAAIAVCLALQLVFTYAPFMNVLFGTEAIDAEAWLRCVAVGLALFVLVEIEKLARRRWRAGAARPARAL